VATGDILEGAAICERNGAGMKRPILWLMSASLRLTACDYLLSAPRGEEGLSCW
jgi:hypothetical protein